MTKKQNNLVRDLLKDIDPDRTLVRDLVPDGTLSMLATGLGISLEQLIANLEQARIKQEEKDEVLEQYWNMLGHAISEYEIKPIILSNSTVSLEIDQEFPQQVILVTDTEAGMEVVHTTRQMISVEDFIKLVKGIKAWSTIHP
jgi:hypothetical protein